MKIKAIRKNKKFKRPKIKGKFGPHIGLWGWVTSRALNRIMDFKIGPNHNPYYLELGFSGL